jgi:two-component system response regulator FlrC
MQRALVLSEAREIDVTHLLFEEMHQVQSSLSTSTLGSQCLPHQSHFAWGNEAAISMDDNVPVNQKSSADLGSMVRDSEYKAIVSVLQKTPNRIKAAEALGISPRTLRYKLARFKELGLVSAEMN